MPISLSDKKPQHSLLSNDISFGLIRITGDLLSSHKSKSKAYPPQSQSIIFRFCSWSTETDLRSYDLDVPIFAKDTE